MPNEAVDTRVPHSPVSPASPSPITQSPTLSSSDPVTVDFQVPSSLGVQPVPYPTGRSISTSSSSSFSPSSASYTSTPYSSVMSPWTPSPASSTSTTYSEPACTSSCCTTPPSPESVASVPSPSYFSPIEPSTAPEASAILAANQRPRKVQRMFWVARMKEEALVPLPEYDREDTATVMSAIGTIEEQVTSKIQDISGTLDTIERHLALIDNSLGLLEKQRRSMIQP